MDCRWLVKTKGVIPKAPTALLPLGIFTRPLAQTLSSLRTSFREEPACGK
jgi:hypothetical protein